VFRRRQKHTLKAVAKHKLEQQLRDPAARLKRLQAQLGSNAASPPPAAAAAAAAAAGAKAASGFGAASSSARGSASDSVRSVSKQLSLQQQRSKAAEPFSRVSSMPCGSSSSSRRQSTGASSSSTTRLMKHSLSANNAVSQQGLIPTGIDGQQQQHLIQNAGGLSTFCSQKQQQGLSLPIIALPQAAASSVAGSAVQKSAGGGLPRLQRT
jgi:hypothetical protein